MADNIKMKKWKLDNGQTKVEIELDKGSITLIIDEDTGYVYSGDEKVPGMYNEILKIFTNKKSEIHSRLGPAIEHKERDIKAFYIDSQRLTTEEFRNHPQVKNFMKSLINLKDTDADSKTT